MDADFLFYFSDGALNKKLQTENERLQKQNDELREYCESLESQIFNSFQQNITCYIVL